MCSFTAKDFSPNLCVQTGSGAQPAFFQWVPEVLSRGKASLGRDADYSPRLVPRSRMSTVLHSFSLVACMAVAGQLLLISCVCSEIWEATSGSLWRLTGRHPTFLPALYLQITQALCSRGWSGADTDGRVDRARLRL
jgi:hypothetical protein